MIESSPPVVSKLFEDYQTPTPLVIKEGLGTLIQFIKPDPSPAQIPGSLLDDALAITEIALKHFNSIGRNNQKGLFEIAQYLTMPQPQRGLGAQQFEEYYKKIAILFCSFGGIKESIRAITMLLTPLCDDMRELSETAMEEYCIFAKIGIKFFHLLHPKRQKHFVKLQQYTMHEQEDLFETPWKKLFYNKVLSIFAGCNLNTNEINPSPALALQPQIVIWRDPTLTSSKPADVFDKIVNLVTDGVEGNASTILTDIPEMRGPSHVNNEILKKALIEAREKLRLEQIKVISRFFEGVLEHYVPHLLQSEHTSPIFLLMDLIQTEFKESFPKTAFSIFFQNPRDVSNREKRFLTAILTKVSQFMTDLNLCRVKKEADTLAPVAEEALIIRRLNKIRPTVVPDSLDRKALLKNLFDLCKQFTHTLWLGTHKSLNKKSSVPELMLALFMLELFDRILTPHTFNLIITRLLESTLNLAGPDDNAPKKPPKKDAAYKEYSKTIGTILFNLGTELIKCGDPEGVTKTAADSIQKILKNMTESIGDAFQDKMNDLSNSECTLLPILFLQHVMFKTEDGLNVPTLLEQFKTSQKEKADLQKKVETNLANKLHPLITEVVQNQNAVAGFLVSNVGSVKKFADNLSKFLWRLTQQELLVKVLLGYILEGINEALAKE